MVVINSDCVLSLSVSLELPKLLPLKTGITY